MARTFSSMAASAPEGEGMARRLVDLTQPLCDGIRGLSTEQKTTIADVGYNTTTLHLYSHAGTHMDAPLHFVEGGDTIDNVSLDVCMGPAELIDLSYAEPNSLLVVADLLPHVERIQPGARLLLRTDWSLHQGQEDFRTHMPRVSPELASWLVARKIALLGVETPSVASVRSGMKAELTQVHQILLKAGIVIVEGLVKLHELRQETVELIVLPLKIRAGDGSPVRAVAVED